MADSRNLLRRTVWSKTSGTRQSRVWTGVVASLPTAAEEYRFFEAIVPGDGSTTWDQAYRCFRQSDGTYQWIAVGTAGVSFITADITLTEYHRFVFVDATAGDITVSLPSSIAAHVYDIKKTDKTDKTVTIDGNGSQTIDDGFTAVIMSQFESITVVGDGSNWLIV